MRNDYSRERRRWDAISSRQRYVDDFAEQAYEDGIFIFDEEWPMDKPAQRRVEKTMTASDARTGKAIRREQKRQREQERAAERARTQHNDQQLGWGGW